MMRWNVGVHTRLGLASTGNFLFALEKGVSLVEVCFCFLGHWVTVYGLAHQQSLERLYCVACFELGFRKPVDLGLVDNRVGYADLKGFQQTGCIGLCGFLGHVSGTGN